MGQLSRRDLIKTLGLGVVGVVIDPGLSKWRTIGVQSSKDVVFRPFPHPLMPPFNYAFATDEFGDPFQAPIEVTREGVVAPVSMADRPFAINARWFVEGFGFVWLDADNEGRLYRMEDFAHPGVRNLNVEFARTRVGRNAERLSRYRREGASFSSEVIGLQDLAANLLDDALARKGETAGDYANRSLLYSLWAGEKIELEKARNDIDRLARTDDFFFGCETRQYVWAKSVTLTERFEELFNYATVTHYVDDTWYEVFEPREGKHRWGIKDNIVDWLTEKGITIEGRPLVWFHPAVTPDWLKQKNFGEVKDYVERHVEAVVGHYGNLVNHWEVVNEYHDWANIHDHTPDQITEIVTLACEKTREVNPDAVRIINNCCPFAGYAAYGHSASGESDRPLRSPRKFMEDLVAADVPFDVVGVQMYFPQRTLADIVRLIERFEVFGKPVHITEIGATSGPTKGDLLSGNREVPGAPYDWHRPWDEDLQADWLEDVYTIFYSKPFIEGASWYDFADFRTFIENGGLIKVDGTRKQSFHRLKQLLETWGRLPRSK
ncbi:MAG: endo-1,4-beta-xylanase [Rhodothermia bacterium]|nr:endo-1,4-beta-xylanase [Rhodothermia bacterium]